MKKKFLAAVIVVASACAPRPAVLLPAVQMDVRPDTSAQGFGVVRGNEDRRVATMEDDPFYTTNRIDWPGPNTYRSSSGRPGPSYWQQRADYRIKASLDTARHSISGTVEIKYTNNSPDTLKYVWLQLDQNLYKSGSQGSSLFSADSRWGVRGFQGGYELIQPRVNNAAVTPRIYDTMMRVDLPEVLRPGASASITMDFRFEVPDHGSDRMGRNGTLYEIAQWYPRMAVYDDVRGWNTDQYLGQGEFYLEYGDIDYSVTVPAGFTVAGSGVLQNPAEVLTAAERSRLDSAARSTRIVRVITPEEAVPRATPGTKTWHFSAGNVRDVAWAAAPDFRWDATSWNRVLCQAFYESPKAGKAWESAAEQTQWTIRHYSETFFPYPYPVATSVAGPVGGMEYPMFVMVDYGTDDPSSIFETLNHEHGHEWFPMIVGSNERRYAWMDEGFNTYINAFAKEARQPGRNIYPTYLLNWQGAVRSRNESPIMTAPDLIDPAALGPMGYRKPAVILLTLRNHVIGPTAFDAAFREYMRDWAFKHPTPGDFFRSIENSTGRDLSWFWRSFFYSTALLDIGIDSVIQGRNDADSSATVVLRRMTSVVFPVVMRVGYADGSHQDFSLPVEIWARTDRFDAVIPTHGAVTGVRLWPDPSVPDWNSANDVWGRPPAADAEHPVTGSK